LKSLIKKFYCKGLKIGICHCCYLLFIDTFIILLLQFYVNFCVIYSFTFYMFFRHFSF
jgi:hypothetical protein